MNEVSNGELIKAIPPANGATVIPHIQEFASIINSATKVFQNPDEAIRFNRTDAQRMRFDLQIMEPLRARQLACAELPWSIEPENKKDLFQQTVAKELAATIEQIPYFLKLKLWLSEAIWFGRSAVQLKYRWNYKSGRKRLLVDSWSPIFGDSLVFDFNGQPGVFVNQAYIQGVTKRLTTRSTDVSVAHFLTEWEREAFIVHKHEIASADFFQSEQAGAEHGLGLRHYCWYTYYLKQEAIRWLTEYMERVGLGFTIFYYEFGNPDSEAAVRKLAEAQAFENVVLWPRSSNGQHLGPGIERVEPNPAGITTLMELIDNFFGRLLKTYIAGQTLTSEAHATGLGSSVSEAHENTFARIVKFDSLNLDETLNRDLLSVLMKWNYPEADFACRFVSSVERPDPQSYMQGVKDFVALGGTVIEDEVRGILGLSKPDANDTVLGGKPAQMESMPGGANTFVAGIDKDKEANGRG